jgi:hypothetical protein
MPNNPREFEEKIVRVLNAFKTLAPAKKFGPIGVEELEMQINKSLMPRRKLEELANEKVEQKALLAAEDQKTMKMVQQLVAKIIADEEYGADSALYEAFGYVRKSERKSGLTRKKKNGDSPPT